MPGLTRLRMQSKHCSFNSRMTASSGWQSTHSPGGLVTGITDGSCGQKEVTCICENIFHPALMVTVIIFHCRCVEGVRNKGWKMFLKMQLVLFTTASLETSSIQYSCKRHVSMVGKCILHRQINIHYRYYND